MNHQTHELKRDLGLTAALAIVPVLVRSLRAGMLEVLGADFVATHWLVRGRGLPT